MANAKKLLPVVVTTEHRGVFFGYLAQGHEATAKIVKLERARMCVYWSPDMRSIMGLAAKGPSKSCKVGPAVPSITLQDVTSVIEVSDCAVKAWEDEPWLN